MTLRVTPDILFRSTLRNVQKSSSRLAALQEQLGTGQRLNRPSDDPVGLLRMLPLQVDLAKLTQQRENLGLAEETLNTGAAALQDASALMIDARTLALQALNGSYSSADRRSLGQEVDQILRSMLAIANSSRAGRHLFAGAETLTAPFQLVEQGGVSRVTYQGDQAEVQVEIGPGIETALNMPGNRIFLGHSRGRTLFVGDTGAAPGSGTDSGLGLDTLRVRHANSSLTGAPPGVALAASSAATDTLLGAGHAITITGTGPGWQLSVDGGPAVSYTTSATPAEVTLTAPNGGTVHLALTNFSGPAGPFTLDSSFRLSTDDGTTWTEVAVPPAAPANVQVLDSVTGQVTNVDASGVQLAGDERVTYQGTFDVFQTLITLRDVLLGGESMSRADQDRILQELLPEIDHAHDMILDGARDLGSRVSRMQLVRGRVENMEISALDVIGQVRDIDLAETIMKISQEENLFQASLAAGAKAVQTSLLDFLR